MTESQKLVLMVQTNRLQGLIWQAVLSSQGIAVIWEAPDTNLVESLNQLKAAGLTLPDLLLLDMRIPNFNAYAFCRWCREACPTVRVVLTNDAQAQISASERQWAINQGAAELFSGFRRETLVSGVAAAVKRVLEILDGHPLNNGALISILLMMKRQLEVRTGLPQRTAVIPPLPEVRRDVPPMIDRDRDSANRPQPNRAGDSATNPSTKDASQANRPSLSVEASQARSMNPLFSNSLASATRGFISGFNLSISGFNPGRHSVQSEFFSGSYTDARIRDA
jgi:CheY-like chemotaxis protein